MAKCPFFEESMWNGNKCKASVGKDGAPIQKRYADYCGANLLSSYTIQSAESNFHHFINKELR